MERRPAPADDEFRRSFERCEIPNDEFRHRDHLRLAWIYLRESDVSTAAARVGQRTRQPHLLDKKLPLRHYSPRRLWNDAARERWVEPDLRPFPGSAG